MGDFLAAYSIQNWLESCPQGYLEDTEYGHERGEREADVIMQNPILLEDIAIACPDLRIAARACSRAE